MNIGVCLYGCRSQKPHPSQKPWFFRPRLGSVAGMHAIVLLPLLSALRDTFRGRAVLQLELLALRHQLATMKRISQRPSLRPTDRLVWVLLSRLLPNWRDVLVIVTPETVIGWHREGFRLFWAWKSRPRTSVCPLLATSRSQGHVASTSASPLTADVRALMSASLSPRPRLSRLWLGWV